MIIVTAADTRYFDLARDLFTSIQACWPEPVPLGFMDIGITDEQRSWLRGINVTIAQPLTRFRFDGLREDPQNKMGYLARPFINEVFPGRDIYIWIDADVWLQDWDGIKALYDGALAKGGCVVREHEKAYQRTWWYRGWQLKHLTRCGGLLGGFLM
jgi:hypothetical protein